MSGAPEKLRSAHLSELRFVSDPRVSHDGSRAAFVVTDIVPGEDPKPPRYRSRIHLASLASPAEQAPAPRPLTQGAYADTRPRFAPDDRRLAFLSRRAAPDARRGDAPDPAARPQLYLLPLDGGEARALTELPAGVLDFAWHPGGERLALLSRGAWRDEHAERGWPRAIDRSFYKLDGQGFRPDAPVLLDALELDGTRTTLAELPCAPAALAFAPDGRRLYLLAAEDVAQEDAWEVNVLALEWPEEPVALDPDARPPLVPLLREAQNFGALAVSGDGARLALLGPSRPPQFGSPTGLWLLDASGGEPRLLSGELDAAPSVAGDARYGELPTTPCWLPDGRLLVALNRAGRCNLARFDPVESAPRPQPLDDEARAVTGFHALAGRVLYTSERPHEPGELFARTLDDGSEVRVTHLNRAFVERFAPRAASAPVEVRVDDRPVGYWRLAPAQPRPDRALVVQVHGGPHTNYGYGFLFEFQLLAARGFEVIYGNPRGGSSFGAAFAGAIAGRYGTVDADDVLAIARHARANHAAPEAPVHLTGGSYGGFMTNWLVAHCHEFASAVTQRSICNWLSFFGASDIGYRFAPQEVGGTPWAQHDELWAQSPLKYVADIATPLLIVHADEDHRCPVEQAEQLFIALKQLGRDTRLLRFPGEGHELSRSGRPDRRVARLDAIVEWFETHPARPANDD